MVIMTCPAGAACLYVTQDMGEAAALGQLQMHVRLTHERGQHGGQGQQGNRGNIKKPDRPKVEIDMTEGAWLRFSSDWGRYKRMTRLDGRQEIVDDLRECGSPTVQARLFELHGTEVLDAADEVQLLGWIKNIAVKGLHKEVHRARFSAVTQKQGEQVQSYLSKLRAAASLCDYNVPAQGACPNDQCACARHNQPTSYEDDMVKMQLVSGLYNQDHKARILAESGTYVTLQAKIDRLVTLEEAEWSLESFRKKDVAESASINSTWSERTCKRCNKKFNTSKFDFCSPE